MLHVHQVGESLVRIIRTIKGQHKAGIPPSFGQCDELFDLAEQLSVELMRDDSPRLVPCTIEECGKPKETQIDGRPYCLRCARVLSIVTKQIEDDAAELARERIAAMVAGRAPWPSLSRIIGLEGTVTVQMPATLTTRPVTSVTSGGAAQ